MKETHGTEEPAGNDVRVLRQINPSLEFSQESLAMLLILFMASRLSSAASCAATVVKVYRPAA